MYYYLPLTTEIFANTSFLSHLHSSSALYNSFKLLLCVLITQRNQWATRKGVRASQLSFSHLISFRGSEGSTFRKRSSPEQTPLSRNIAARFRAKGKKKTSFSTLYITAIRRAKREREKIGSISPLSELIFSFQVDDYIREGQRVETRRIKAAPNWPRKPTATRCAWGVSAARDCERKRNDGCTTVMLVYVSFFLCSSLEERERGEVFYWNLALVQKS